jgi:hypothetical protein
MADNFSLDHAGVGELLRSGDMEAEMRRRAEKAMSFAVAIAPVGDPKNDQHAGRYAASFRVSSSRHGGMKGDRAAAELVNDSPEAYMVEYGNRNVKKHRILAKSIDAMRD